MKKTGIYKSEKGREEVLQFYGHLLGDWPTSNEKREVLTKYGTTFVIESGQKDAPVLVLLHGSATNSAMWKEDARVYSKNFLVVAIDIPGEAGRSSENRIPYQHGEHADWLMDLFQQLEIEEAIVVGCSTGGWVALDFTLKYPDRVSKLVLLASAGLSPIKLGSVFKIMMVSVFGRWGFEQVNKMVYGNLEIEPVVLQFAELLKQDFNPRTDPLPIFSDAQLQQINCPVLFMGGDADCFYNSEKSARRLQKSCSNAICVILPNTGHVLTDTVSIIYPFIKNEKA